MRRVTLLRFLDQIEPSACWNWSGEITKKGYARFNYDKKRTGGHRAIYEHIFGPISDNLTIDHLCRHRRCVNPLHLEAVTNTVNVLRGESIPAQNARKTHCNRGHLLAGRNLNPRKDGHRECRACIKLRIRKHK
jgi:HNH endonuclease